MENFFNPKSVAVIGASSDPKKVGYALVSNLIEDKNRKIFPISISETEILGIKTTNSILDVNEEIDLAIIAVRADIVPQVLTDCGKKNILSVIIISSGFKEMGEEGKKLEGDVIAIANEYNINILGPNCLGVINTKNNLNASFSGQKPLLGKIAFLSQSGALGTALIDWAISEGIGFSKFVSLGNEAGLTEIDFLKYLENDEDSSSIIMYLENINNGPEFMEIVSRITKNKPVVIIKAGMGGHGSLAVMSHTGALAPEASVFVSACKQAGAVTASSLRGVFNIVKLLSQGLEVNKPLQRFIILTNGGGPSVIAADLIDHSHSLSLIELSDNTKNALRKVLPPMAAFGNPIDIIGDALADRYDKALEILCDVKEADGIIVILTPQMMTEVDGTAKVLAKYKNNKKIFPVFIGGPSILEGRKTLIESGLVHFTFAKDVIEGLDYLANNQPKIKSHDLNKESNTGYGKSVELEMMSYEIMSHLFSDYDISLNGVLAKDKFEIGPLLKKLKFDDFSLKAISPDMVHKTEFKAVALNLKTIDEAENFWDRIKKENPKAKIEGVLLQPMAYGKEIIIGMKRDSTFGPTILFGLGGILAEAIKDTTLRVAPIEKDEAMKMMKEIKGIKILDGMRGEKPVDFDSLAEIIVNLSQLSLEHPEIKEIDLNPVIVTETNATIVDARIMI